MLDVVEVEIWFALSILKVSSSLIGDGDLDRSESPPMDIGSGESEDFLFDVTKRPDPRGANEVLNP